MNKILLQLFAVGLCFAAGQALQCYSCFGFWNLCGTSKITCNAGELCYSGIGKAAKLVDVKRKGCVEVLKCNQTSTVSFPDNSTTIYTMTKTCCNTDLCNAAPGQPAASGLSLAFATVAALLVTKALV